MIAFILLTSDFSLSVNACVIIILAMGSSAAAEQAKPFVYVICYQFGPASTK
jgi:hypothetical protein